MSLRLLTKTLLKALPLYSLPVRCLSVSCQKFHMEFHGLGNRSLRHFHTFGRCQSDKPDELKEVDTNKKTIDVDEEMSRYVYEDYEEKPVEPEPEDTLIESLPSYLCQRGERGVFDVHQMIELLKADKMKDICVISIPKEINYCEEMIIATGKSIRQLKAVSEKIRINFKVKRNKDDPENVDIEGTKTEWFAIDLGNIVVHLFMKKERTKYNLEELWTVGPEFDEQCLQKDNEEDAGPSPDNFSFEEELRRFKNRDVIDRGN